MTRVEVQRGREWRGEIEGRVGMDEAERQRLVWDSLHRKLNEDERVAVEFVFTIAPDDPDAGAAD